jgi:hypothetical protein
MEKIALFRVSCCDPYGSNSRIGLEGLTNNTRTRLFSLLSYEGKRSMQDLLRAVSSSLPRRVSKCQLTVSLGRLDAQAGEIA